MKKGKQKSSKPMRLIGGVIVERGRMGRTHKRKGRKVTEKILVGTVGLEGGSPLREQTDWTSAFLFQLSCPGGGKSVERGGQSLAGNVRSSSCIKRG